MIKLHAGLKWDTLISRANKMFNRKFDANRSATDVLEFSAEHNCWLFFSKLDKQRFISALEQDCGYVNTIII